MNDQFVFKGKRLNLSGYSAGNLFDPVEFGLEPVSNCTACWNGYLCYYTVVNEQLILDKLLVNLYEPHLEWVRKPGPVLNGVTPIELDSEDWFNNHYNNFGLYLNYTGGLLLTDGFLDQYYVHMGFHPVWKYEYVIELIFESGKLINEINQSSRMAEIRTRIDSSDKLSEYDLKSDEEIMNFIESSFERSY